MSGWRSLCVRVQTASSGADVVWLHVVMRLCDVTAADGDVTAMTSRRVIVCMNQLVDAGEARAIRAGDAPPPPPWDGHQLGLLRDGGVGLLLDDARPTPAGATKRRAPGTEAWGRRS